MVRVYPLGDAIHKALIVKELMPLRESPSGGFFCACVTLCVTYLSKLRFCFRLANALAIPSGVLGPVLIPPWFLHLPLGSLLARPRVSC